MTSYDINFNPAGVDLAVAGATGLVGRTMLTVLAERRFPIRSLSLFASERSTGTTITCAGREIPVQALTVRSLVDSGACIALFSAGATVSRAIAPGAAKAGMTIIDNSSAFRMDDAIPLVVPEVNGDILRGYRGIIANPNCSTIQIVLALKPLHDRFHIRRVIVSTYQSVSGAGQAGVLQYEQESRGEVVDMPKFPVPIFGNLIPHIDEFLEDGSTKEEQKMILETPKIMRDQTIRVSATCVRVPVPICHSEAVMIECERPCDPSEARQLLRKFPGVVVMDELKSGGYPTPANVAGRDEVFVGRIRRDPSVENGLQFWIVADNIRKGAATNAVQIAEVVLNNQHE